MTDEEYVFHQTNRERKRNGRGNFSKKRQGGKVVTLPSDSLTRKEWEKMNGEVLTFEFDQPRSWEVYQQIPDNLKFEYLKYLWAKYEATPTMLGDMLGVDRKKVMHEQKRLGLVCPTKRGHQPRAVIERWEKFVGKNDLFKVAHAEPKELDIVSIISALAGSGAKLTIEVTL